MTRSSCIFSIIMLISAATHAQPRYTVVLPVLDKTLPARQDQYLHISATPPHIETAKAFLDFNLAILPQQAKLTSATLRLYVAPNDNTPGWTAQTITVLKKQNLADTSLRWTDIKYNKSIGKGEITKNTLTANINLDLPKRSYASAWVTDNTLSLAARSPAENIDNRFYSTATATSTGQYNQKPKLILRYEIAPYPFRADWSQPYASAAHTSNLNWFANTTITNAKTTKLYDTPNEFIAGADPTGAIAIYKNQPIIFVQSVNGTGKIYSVRQLDDFGKPTWSQPVDEIATSGPLIDQQARLYYFSMAGKLSILDLENKGAILQTSSIGTLTGNTTDTGIAALANPTLGYDGSLYIPTADGITALSAYPQCAIRWKYKASQEKTGAVSLSADETKACFISVKGQDSARLIVLDNLDGTQLATYNIPTGGYRNDLNYFIPAPVVLNNTGAFVLNGFDNGNQLLFFSFDTRVNNPAFTINSGQITNTGISQPSIDGNGNTFLVFNEHLARIDPSNPAQPAVFNNSGRISNAAILVTDDSANIYGLDPYNNANKLLGFHYNTKQKECSNSFECNLGTIGNLRKNLALSPHGILYTVTNTSLIAISPLSIAANTLDLSPASIKANTLYRATKTINITSGIVTQSINAILYAGESISFKPGVSIRKGTQLSCKTSF